MDNTESIYEKSVVPNTMGTKSFNIDNLFLVAFFGGVIPMVVLGAKNAKWLNISKKLIYMLIIFGAALLVTKLVFVAMITSGSLDLDNTTLNISYRVGSVLLFIAFKLVLNKAFHQHMVVCGKMEALLKPALIWIVVGIVVEFVLVVAVSM
ncbi:hypothetical protein GMD78_12560 [Ornithinibacillus sp. L9]|uniref:Uncharacterized protein n=1 Tax=Ornithinibacillus caprae TaxID=2678566 RepID=A0A6N8FLG1_9BACI|nr:hypothetical protein [Ornithinibacillus caprae]MUK89204.1 hypothetical protein [Ornithinibacillus caprae]